VKNAYSHAGDDRWALSRILVERDLDTAALTRLVTRPVLPVGRRRERPTTVGWRTYRRARALVTAARGGATPVARTGTSRSPCSTPSWPARCRRWTRGAGGGAGAAARPSARDGPGRAGRLARGRRDEQLGEAVAQHLADDGLAPMTAGPRGRATAQPAHRPAPPAS
jgi:hypothetical protein